MKPTHSPQLTQQWILLPVIVTCGCTCIHKESWRFSGQSERGYFVYVQYSEPKLRLEYSSTVQYSEPKLRLECSTVQYSEPKLRLEYSTVQYSEPKLRLECSTVQYVQKSQIDHNSRFVFSLVSIFLSLSILSLHLFIYLSILLKQVQQIPTSQPNTGHPPAPNSQPVPIAHQQVRPPFSTGLYEDVLIPYQRGTLRHCQCG